MELWGWLIGYVVLFALLHLVLYYVYVRRDEDDGTASPAFADPNRARPHASPESDRYAVATDDSGDIGPPEEEHEVAGESVSCHHCGAENAADPAFTYCWHCVSALRR